MSNLTGTFIANTYQNLVQKPDAGLEDYYNGVGATISVINRDEIGTIKMFYPVGALSDWFDTSTGLGVPRTGWKGWAIANGQNGTPNLSGKFVVGYDGGLTYSFGNTGGANSFTMSLAQLPTHDHEIGMVYQQYVVDPIHLYPEDPAVRAISNAFPIFSPDWKTEQSGSSSPIDNRPSYISLIYVMRIS